MNSKRQVKINNLTIGGWRVYIQEFGRGNIYEEYIFKDEREACIKFIEITDEYYHLSKYLSEFSA